MEFSAQNWRISESFCGRIDIVNCSVMAVVLCTLMASHYHDSHIKSAIKVLNTEKLNLRALKFPRSGRWRCQATQRHQTPKTHNCAADFFGHPRIAEEFISQNYTFGQCLLHHFFAANAAHSETARLVPWTVSESSAKNIILLCCSLIFFVLAEADFKWQSELLKVLAKPRLKPTSACFPPVGEMFIREQHKLIQKPLNTVDRN